MKPELALRISFRPYHNHFHVTDIAIGAPPAGCPLNVGAKGIFAFWKGPAKNFTETVRLIEPVPQTHPEYHDKTELVIYSRDVSNEAIKKHSATLRHVGLRFLSRKHLQLIQRGPSLVEFGFSAATTKIQPTGQLERVVLRAQVSMFTNNTRRFEQDIGEFRALFNNHYLLPNVLRFTWARHEGDNLIGYEIPQADGSVLSLTPERVIAYGPKHLSNMEEQIRALLKTKGAALHRLDVEIIKLPEKEKFLDMMAGAGEAASKMLDEAPAALQESDTQPNQNGNDA